MNGRSVAVIIAALLVVTSVSLAADAKCCPKGPELKIWGSLDSKPKIAQGYEPQTVEIGIGAYKLLELRGAAAGYTLPEREVAVYNRLVEALSQGALAPEDICVGQVRSAPTIYVRNVRLVSVYAKDAEAVKMTQAALAQAWRDRLAEVLPKITAVTKELVTTPTLAAQEAVPVYDVAVGGTLLFRLHGPDGYPTVRSRALAVEDKIVQMLSDGKYVPTVARPEPVGKQWVVMFGKVRLVTVTNADAAASKTTPQVLAGIWADKINAQLAKLKGPTQVKQ